MAGEVLPAWARDHILAAAEALQVPIDLCAQQALGAMALAAEGVTVRVTSTHTEPLVVWLATAMPSGAGKSAADKVMLAPIRAMASERVAARLDAPAPRHRPGSAGEEDQDAKTQEQSTDEIAALYAKTSTSCPAPTPAGCSSTTPRPRR